jgi:hypothetical protein
MKAMSLKRFAPVACTPEASLAALMFRVVMMLRNECISVFPVVSPRSFDQCDDAQLGLPGCHQKAWVGCSGHQQKMGH